jgi:hypothetical protein
MTKKPIRRYTIDGKTVTPDDLRRLHDYLIEIETIPIISDGNACRGRERLVRTGPQAAPEMTIPRGTYIGRPVGEPPKDEAEHYIRCPGCGGWIDCRDLGQALAHAGDLSHAFMPDDHPQ